MTQEYRIVVLSNRNADRMPGLLKLLPDATVCCHASESDDYKEHVPAEQLVTHKESDPVSAWNSLLTTFDEPCLVKVSDEFRRLLIVRENARAIGLQNAETIRDVIESTLQVATDLDAAAFCWGRHHNGTTAKVFEEPFKTVPALTGAFGIRGKVRRQPLDVECEGLAPLNLSLEILRDHRFLWQDARFVFDCGDQAAERVSDSAVTLMQSRWKRSLSKSKNGYGVRVRRKSPAARL